MPYQDIRTFKKDYDAAQDLSIAGGQLMGGVGGRVDATIGWNTYLNAGKARSGTGLMLFGRHVMAMRSLIAKRARAACGLRSQAIEAKNTEMTKSWTSSKSRRIAEIGELNRQNLDLTEREKKPEVMPPAVDTDRGGAMVENFGIVNNADSGSILLMGNQNWNFTINDTWLLGAVHRRLPFYPASNVTRANIYDSEHILTITGRELFGLAIFGYAQRNGAEGMGTAFAQSDVLKATGATLLHYQQRIDALNSISDAEQVFTKAGFRVSELGI